MSGYKLPLAQAEQPGRREGIISDPADIVIIF